MTTIVVCPLSGLEETLQQSNAHFLVSLLSMVTEFARPANISAKNHLILRFNDITTPTDGLILPDECHIRQLLEFAQGWDQNSPLVVHCWAGVSRSPAAAAIIAMALNPARDVGELAATLRALSPSMTPNIRMIELADGLLSCNGQFTRAIRQIGRGRDTFEGNRFHLDL